MSRVKWTSKKVTQRLTFIGHATTLRDSIIVTPVCLM